MVLLLLYRMKRLLHLTIKHLMNMTSGLSGCFFLPFSVCSTLCRLCINWGIWLTWNLAPSWFCCLRMLDNRMNNSEREGKKHIATCSMSKDFPWWFTGVWVWVSYWLVINNLTTAAFPDMVVICMAFLLMLGSLMGGSSSDYCMFLLLLLLLVLSLFLFNRKQNWDE